LDVPSPNFITEPDEIGHCDKSIQIINFSTDYDSLMWDFGNGFVSSEDTVTSYTYDEVGQYQINLKLINEFGCENSFNREIKPVSSIPFYAPNAFTPDGDQLNEEFVPYMGCTDSFEFWIMDRWGEVIFYSNDVNVGWNGTFKGKLCPVGVYSWKAKYNGAKHNQVKLGDVHLMH
jgi:gliding motility-associated-like protein